METIDEKEKVLALAKRYPHLSAEAIAVDLKIHIKEVYRYLDELIVEGRIWTSFVSRVGNEGVASLADILQRLNVVGFLLV